MSSLLQRIQHGPQEPQKSWDAGGGHLHPSLSQFLSFISPSYLSFIFWVDSMRPAMPTEETSDAFYISYTRYT